MDSKQVRKTETRDRIHGINSFGIKCAADLVGHTSDLFLAWAKEVWDGILVTSKATLRGKLKFSQLGVWDLTEELSCHLLWNVVRFKNSACFLAKPFRVKKVFFTMFKRTVLQCKTNSFPEHVKHLTARFSVSVLWKLLQDFI